MARATRGLVRTEKIVIPAVLAVALAAFAAWVLVKPAPPAPITASGTIEVIQSDVSAKVQGRLVALYVRDGESVRKGQILARLEQTDPALNFEQARAAAASAAAAQSAAQAAYDLQQRTYETQVQQASEGVTIAGAGVGQAGDVLAIESQNARSQVDQADAQLDAARSAFDRAQVQYRRIRSLVATGDEPRQALDDATAQFRAATAQLQNAGAASAIARANRRNVDVRRYGVQTARSQMAQSESALRSSQAQWQLVLQRHAQLLAAAAQADQARAAERLAQNQLTETSVKAPYDGSVISHNFEVGNLLPAGSGLLTIADVRHPYVYVYISETLLPKIKTGMHAGVRIDAFPGRTFDGVVTEIGSSAEFTPENVQTTQERIEYLVFRVKIQLTDTTGTLKAGLPADATIRV